MEPKREVDLHGNDLSFGGEGSFHFEPCRPLINWTFSCKGMVRMIEILFDPCWVCKFVCLKNWYLSPKRKNLLKNIIINLYMKIQSFNSVFNLPVEMLYGKSSRNENSVIKISKNPAMCYQDMHFVHRCF